MKKVQVETQITESEFVRLMYILTYRSASIIFLTCVGALFIAWSILNVFYSSENSPSAFVFGITLWVVIPFSVYRRATTRYRSHQRLHEKIVYTFTNEVIQIDGESFHSNMTWGKCYQVIKIRNFFMIYQSKTVANFVNKRTFTKDQLIEFREIVKGVPGLKAKLEA